MAYIWEDKIFRQLCIGSRLDRAFVSNADLEQRIACAARLFPLFLRARSFPSGL